MSVNYRHQGEGSWQGSPELAGWDPPALWEQFQVPNFGVTGSVASAPPRANVGYLGLLARIGIFIASAFGVKIGADAAGQVSEEVQRVAGVLGGVVIGVALYHAWKAIR